MGQDLDLLFFILRVSHPMKRRLHACSVNQASIIHPFYLAITYYNIVGGWDVALARVPLFTKMQAGCHLSSIRTCAATIQKPLLATLRPTAVTFPSSSVKDKKVTVEEGRIPPACRPPCHHLSNFPYRFGHNTGCSVLLDVPLVKHSLIAQSSQCGMKVTLISLCQDCDPATTTLTRKILKQKIPLQCRTVVDILEDVGWYVTLTILITCIPGGIQMDNFDKLFK